MDLFKDMKGPTRPAPTIPGVVNRYSPVTNWDDDPFGAEVFEPTPHYNQKKKPPPRPPPPKVGQKHPDVPAKPTHFIRKPTVLSSLLSRKTKTTASNQNINNVQHTSKNNLIADFNSDVDPHKMFPKCEPKNTQTGALIDLSSPPSSPTFTTRSSSDGLSVDSFGSDATTSTNHHNNHNGGNASQAESGFEDDFDLFLQSKRPLNKEDTLEDFTAIDPFSPQPVVNKPPIMKKPTLSRDLYEISNSSYNQVAGHLHKGPTIIRAKPARPKPPDNSSILKNTFGGSFPATMMTVNTKTPIQKVANGFGDTFESKLLNWDERESSPERELSPDREPSPPMPTIPPPPPPAEADEEVISTWATDASVHLNINANLGHDDENPYAVALFDYYTNHPDDLCFSANSIIKLIRRVDHEWLFGSLKSGVEGLFPSNYVEIKVSLPNEPIPPSPLLCTAIAVYDFEPQQPGDLGFNTGDTILVRSNINDEWYLGECNGTKGQFPINYVQTS